MPPEMEQSDLNDEVRSRWDANAAFWDERMGEGNAFHKQLVEPSVLQLLELVPGEGVLEVACGNGQFARKLASLGAHVTATDLSPRMIEQARAHGEAYNDRVDYRVVDATDETALRRLGQAAFDAILCNMALMDMAEIEPLFRAAAYLLKPTGRFVFATAHPCFNTSGMQMTLEASFSSGGLVEVRGLKLTRYLKSTPEPGIAMLGQPVPHFYFDRPLSVLLGAAFRAGLVMDGLLEPSFAETEPSPRALSWINLNQFPPVITARLKLG